MGGILHMGGTPVQSTHSRIYTTIAKESNIWLGCVYPLFFCYFASMVTFAYSFLKLYIAP